MTALSIILNIVLILISIVLIAVVLMQQGQRQGLGAIAGGAETFFGKGKVKGLDSKLAKITKIAAIAFIVLAIACTIVVSHIDKSTADLDSVVNEIAETVATDADTVEAEPEVEAEPAEVETEAAAEPEAEVEAEAETEAVSEPAAE